MGLGKAIDMLIETSQKQNRGLLARLKSATLKFGRKEDGSLIVFALLMFLLMLVIGGLAVDVMRLETKRTRLQYTQDRAILAAASLNQDLDPVAVVEDYFAKAGLTNFDLEIDHETLESAGQRNYRRVTVNTELNMNTYFMKLVGIRTLSAPAGGTAVEGITDVEISLVVDVSGSMGRSSSSGSTKLAELKDAAEEFGYAMLCNPNDPDRTATCTVEEGRVSLSIIPYAEQVDVGAQLASHYNISSEHSNSHCVDFTTADFSSTGVDPEVELSRAGHFDPWYGSNSNPSYFPCDPVGSGRSIQPFLSDYNDVDTFINSLWANGSTSIDQGMKWGVALLDPMARPVIEGLTTGTDAIVDAAFNERPLDFNEQNSSKVIVLMTDGKHEGRSYLYEDVTATANHGGTEISYSGFKSGMSGFYYDELSGHYSVHRISNNRYLDINTGNWYDEPYAEDPDNGNGEWERECYSYYDWRGRRRWYCEWVEGEYEPGDPEYREGVATQLTWVEIFEEKTMDWVDNYSDYTIDGTDPDSDVAPWLQDAQLAASCEAAKDEGVLIFTIGFEVHDNYLDVMRNCASTVNHFFSVDGTEISAAFATIASQINRLRLTQ